MSHQISLDDRIKRANEVSQLQYKTDVDKGKNKIKIYSPSEYQKKIPYGGKKRTYKKLRNGRKSRKSRKIRKSRKSRKSRRK